MYVDTIRTIGKLRVILEIDDAPEDPRAWSEPATGAVTFPSRDYGEVSEPGPLAHEWARLLERHETHSRGARGDVLALFDRYVRVFHAGIVQQSSTTYGPTVLFYLTRARAEEDGIPLDRMAATVAAELSEWESYAEGDVYVAQVQQLTTWTSTRGEVREEWEYLDSCGGLVGRDYAEQYAIDMLLDALLPEITPSAFVDGAVSVTTTVVCRGCDQLVTVTDGKTECGGEGEGACDRADETDHTRAFDDAAALTRTMRTIYVVTDTGVLDWRETEDEARDAAEGRPGVRWFAAMVPADTTGDAVTEYLTSRGWTPPTTY